MVMGWRADDILVKICRWLVVHIGLVKFDDGSTNSLQLEPNINRPWVGNSKGVLPRMSCMGMCHCETYGF